MFQNTIPDIPRLYTAIAEWLSCFTFVMLLGPRIKRLRLGIYGAIYLLFICFFLEVTASIPFILWVLCIPAAFLFMVLFIKLCNKLSFYESIFYAVMAFSIAECVASFEWQIVNFFFNDTSTMPLYFEIPAIILVYGGVLFGIWALLSSRITGERRLRIEKKDWFISLFICIIVFGLSNVSFISLKSATLNSYSFQIGWVRTLVDVAGVAMLYAHLLSCYNNMVRRELDAIQSTLKNQYVQYKQSRESIDIINMKYHDMKHQINLLREMNDSGERAALLDRMEADIKNYELQNKTGNSVLDTLLTGKSMQCVKHNITMTVVADGSLLDFMDAVDICSIFGNALDNAIEAAKKIKDKKKRLIHLTLSKFKSFVMIRIENYFEEQLIKDDGGFVTTKKNAKNHGYGIKSINYTAERYGGVADIKVKDNWFEVKILIPINEK